jgi:hypothetical protein
MQSKIIIAGFLALVVAGLSVFGAYAISRGGTIPAVLIMCFVLLFFIAIPAVGALRSAHTGTLVMKRRAVVKSVCLFVLSPLAVAAIVIFTHSISPWLAAGLSVAVMLAAASFYFLVD